MDKIIDLLNDFMESDNRDDNVDNETIGLAQYFDDLFTNCTQVILNSPISIYW